ncbi:MAG: hypothetical protein HYV27_12250 [Candidatus Hydrogenedentes bacterium]|nr:hypothetical protein [Candidatus Hydrogenedentota bacterium]
MRNVPGAMATLMVMLTAVPVLGAFIVSGISLTTGDQFPGLGNDSKVVFIFSTIFLIVLVRILSRIGRNQDGVDRADLRDVERRLARLEAKLNVTAPPMPKHRRSERSEESELVQALHEQGSKMQERLENLETVLIDKGRP